ncbi:MAG: hypothetical protein ACYCPR_05500 [Thermoplasmataceae archaeon]
MGLVYRKDEYKEYKRVYFARSLLHIRQFVADYTKKGEIKEVVGWNDIIQGFSRCLGYVLQPDQDQECWRIKSKEVWNICWEKQ